MIDVRWTWQMMTSCTFIQDVHISLRKSLQRNPEDLEADPISAVPSPLLLVFFPWIQLTSLKMKILQSLLTHHYPQTHIKTRTRRTWMSETKNKRQELASVLLNIFNTALTWWHSVCRDQVYCCVCIFLSTGNLSCVPSSAHRCFLPEVMTRFPVPCLRPNSPKILG